MITAAFRKGASEDPVKQAFRAANALGSGREANVHTVQGFQKHTRTWGQSRGYFSIWFVHAQ